MTRPIVSRRSGARQSSEHYSEIGLSRLPVGSARARPRSLGLAWLLAQELLDAGDDVRGGEAAQRERRPPPQHVLGTAGPLVRAGVERLGGQVGPVGVEREQEVRLLLRRREHLPGQDAIEVGEVRARGRVELGMAARELQQGLDANPKYADAYAELGLVLMKQKEYGRAEQALQRALELDPPNYRANFNLLILYQRNKDPRAKAQERLFEEVKKKRAERAAEFLRTIEVRPH